MRIPVIPGIVITYHRVVLFGKPVKMEYAQKYFQLSLNCSFFIPRNILVK